MKKYLFLLIAIALPCIALAGDPMNTAANAVIASNKSLKPDARHAAVALALVDKNGKTVSIDPATGQIPLKYIVSGTNHIIYSGTAAVTSGTSAGTPGTVKADGTYFYFCTGSNRWIRTTGTTW